MNVSRLRPVLIGVMLSAGPIAVLAHGILGAGSVATGFLLALPIAFLIVLGDWRSLRLNVCDALYAVFVCCVAVSLLVVGYADRKEVVLLTLSVAAYPAGRLSGSDILSRGALSVVIPVLIAGTFATAIALVAQWSAPHGKPLVFGQFDAAPAQFTMLLATLILMAATSDRISLRQMMLFGAAAAVPAVIFAASMVRFVFVALVASLAVAVLLNPSTGNRKIILSVLFVGVLVIAIGLATRWQTTSAFLSHAIASAGNNVSCQEIDTDNSIAIRKQLYADAITIFPNSGPLGIGMGKFAQRGCLKGYEIHNTFLQVAIEFGWLTGIVFAALIILSIGASTISMAFFSQEFRFVTCYIIFNILLSFTYGRVSREVILFFFVGYAVRLRESRFEIAKE